MRDTAVGTEGYQHLFSRSFIVGNIYLFLTIRFYFKICFGFMTHAKGFKLGIPG